MGKLNIGCMGMIRFTLAWFIITMKSGMKVSFKCHMPDHASWLDDVCYILLPFQGILYLSWVKDKILIPLYETSVSDTNEYYGEKILLTFCHLGLWYFNSAFNLVVKNLL